MISTDRGRRIRGWIGYVFAVIVVAAAFVWVFHYFTGDLWAAVLVVAVMFAYMLLMAFWASRNIETSSGKIKS